MSKKPNPFVIDVVGEFLHTKEPKEPKTFAAYSGILRGSVRGTKPALGIPFEAFFQNRRFGTIEHDEVAQWFAQRVAGGAQATKHRVSKNSRAFLRFAHERGYTDRDLWMAISPYKASGPRVDWLEWQEIHELLEAMPEYRYRMAAAWLFWTGCRVNEACSAQQADVKFIKDVSLYQWTIPDTKTHIPRNVWLPGALATYVETSRSLNSPKPDWPILWDCAGRGFGRVEDPREPISPRMINSALERARDEIGITIHVTAHVAKHSYCTNWIQTWGDSEIDMVKLSRQVGTSVEVLRRTYVHVALDASDWDHIRTFGAG